MSATAAAAAATRTNILSPATTAPGIQNKDEFMKQYMESLKNYNDAIAKVVADALCSPVARHHMLMFIREIGEKAKSRDDSESEVDDEVSEPPQKKAKTVTVDENKPEEEEEEEDKEPKEMTVFTQADPEY
jgi:hypothetical protein